MTSSAVSVVIVTRNRLRSERNMGAPGRSVGVRHASTPYAEGVAASPCDVLT